MGGSTGAFAQIRQAMQQKRQQMGIPQAPQMPVRPASTWQRPEVDTMPRMPASYLPTQQAPENRLFPFRRRYEDPNEAPGNLGGIGGY